MRVLITRAEPAASRTAKKLSDLGHEPVICPIFELADTGGPAPENDAEHYIFTSANAVEILARRNWRPTNIQSTAWCVGERTAKAAKALGFTKTPVATGGGAKLTEQIVAKDHKTNATFVYPTTPDRSFDMREALASFGITVEPVEIYQTVKVVPDVSLIGNFFTGSKTRAIFVFSDRSAAHLVDILNDFDELSGFDSILVISISQSAANIMLNCSWQGVYVSPQPNEASMISRLQEFSKA